MPPHAGRRRPSCKAVSKRLLRREDPPRIRQIAQDIIAHEACEDRRPRHVGHEAPFDFHDRHPRIGSEKAHVRTQRELEAAAKGNPLDRGITGTGNCRQPHTACCGELASP